MTDQKLVWSFCEVIGVCLAETTELFPSNWPSTDPLRNVCTSAARSGVDPKLQLVSSWGVKQEGPFHLITTEL